MNNETKCCIEQTIMGLCKRIVGSPDTVKINETRAQTVLLLTEALHTSEKAAAQQAAARSAVDGFTEGLKG